MIHIYDGNNYYRRLLETDPTGLAPRTVLSKVTVNTDPVVFVWDGKGGNAKRRALFPDYKLRRTPPKQDIFAGFDTLQEVLKHTHAIQVEVPGYEGDDVVAAIARHYAGAGHDVAVYSNDFDFMQLAAEFPRSVFVGAQPKADVSPHLVRYFKTCVGDPSDNIPGIAGFGQKSWEEADKGRLADFIDCLVAGDPPPDFPFSKRVKNWIDENADLIRTFWTIVGFLPVSLDEISKHMTVGKPNYAAADDYLKGFYL